MRVAIKDFLPCDLGSVYPGTQKPASEKEKRRTPVCWISREVGLACEAQTTPLVGAPWMRRHDQLTLEQPWIDIPARGSWKRSARSWMRKLALRSRWGPDLVREVKHPATEHAEWRPSPAGAARQTDERLQLRGASLSPAGFGELPRVLPLRGAGGSAFTLARGGERKDGVSRNTLGRSTVCC